jgi:hypothetical protein
MGRGLRRSVVLQLRGHAGGRVERDLIQDTARRAFTGARAPRPVDFQFPLRAQITGRIRNNPVS